MPTKGLGLYLGATKAGAFAQAVDQAAKSDQQSCKPIRRKQQQLSRRAIWIGVIALGRLMSGPAWALFVIVLTIAIELVVFSD